MTNDVPRFDERQTVMQELKRLQIITQQLMQTVDVSTILFKKIECVLLSDLSDTEARELALTILGRSRNVRTR
jgi:uncharacterized protein YaaW (UPF0174 family)